MSRDAKVGEIEALSQLVRRIDSSASLLGGVEERPCLVAPAGIDESRDTTELYQRLLDEVTGALKLPSLLIANDERPLTSFDLALTEQVRVSGDFVQVPRLLGLKDHLPEIVEQVRLRRGYRRSDIHRRGKPMLRAYSAGNPSSPKLVIVLPCGMPVELVEKWMTGLSDDFHVLSWETRGLLEDVGDFDERAAGLEAQVEDLFSVLMHFDAKDAHIMGLCGGAVIALAAASCERINSLSLWHGDYESGGAAPKTRHQDDVSSMLRMAAAGRGQASNLRKLFARPRTMQTMPATIAHYLLCPFANSERLYRYGLLNGSIMSTDCRLFVDTVRQPTLVVSSEDDHTAHPEGSRFVASQLKQGALFMRPSRGGHLSLFDPEPPLIQSAITFVKQLHAEA